MEVTQLVTACHNLSEDDIMLMWSNIVVVRKLTNLDFHSVSALGQIGTINHITIIDTVNFI